MTGDVFNCSQTLPDDLASLGNSGIRFYFVSGNHENHGSSIEDTKAIIRASCKRYSNLIWMTDVDVVSINKETALIGHEGWYDARIGNPNHIKYTFDWFLIKDFSRLSNMSERLIAFRKLADESAKIITYKLEAAIKTHDTVLLLTHIPPFQSANRWDSLLGRDFWSPYNANVVMGVALKSIMDNNKDKKLIVLAGHTHHENRVRISDNIECVVGGAGHIESIYI